MAERDASQANEATRREDEAESHAAHRADRPPTAEEERSAEASSKGESEEERRSVAEHFEEMAERGVEEKGEGRIT